MVCLRDLVLGFCCLAYKYTSKLFDITHAHLPEVHCYADYTQTYLSFRPNATSESAVAISAIMNCITDTLRD